MEGYSWMLQVCLHTPGMQRREQICQIYGGYDIYIIGCCDMWTFTAANECELFFPLAKEMA